MKSKTLLYILGAGILIFFLVSWKKSETQEEDSAENDWRQYLPEEYREHIENVNAEAPWYAYIDDWLRAISEIWQTYRGTRTQGSTYFRPSSIGWGGRF